MIFKELNENEFVNEFKRFDREDNFTKEALSYLYDELESFEEDIKLDIISICCNYSEYTIEEAKKQYNESINFNNNLNNQKFIDKLREYTTVIPIGNTGRIIIEDF